MQFGELISMVSDLVVVSDTAAVVRWLNNAYKKLAYESKTIAETADTVSLVGGQQEYDFPDDCYSDGIVRVAFDSVEVPYITMADLEDHDEDWQTVEDTEPQYYYVRGRKYGFHPIPSANDSDAITVFYFQMPGDLIGGDTPSMLDADLHDYIAYGAAHMAALFTGDDRAAYFKRMFDEGMIETRRRGSRRRSEESIWPTLRW